MKKEKRLPLWFEEHFDNIRQMEEEFHKMMSRFWREPFEFRIPETNFNFPKEFMRTIPIKVSEEDDKFILLAEIPGFSKDEVKLKVTPTSVDISAEKKRVSIEKAKDFYKAEKGFSSARRVFSLPSEVKTEGAKAKFENGLLKIILSKKEIKKKVKELEVE